MDVTGAFEIRNLLDGWNKFATTRRRFRYDKDTGQKKDKNLLYEMDVLKDRVKTSGSEISRVVVWRLYDIK